jgi:cobalt/nickel transport system permease protein
MAHIPDGFLSPAVLAGSAALSGGVLWLAARRTRAALADRQLPLLGAVTAFVFAAQLCNFPLAAGTSAHLLGGVLVAALAGPSVAVLVIFSVVLVQALLFQDGGLAALGANTLNLAVLGAGGGWLVFRWLLALLGSGRRARLAAAGVAAFASALLTGTGVALELALSGAVAARPALLVIGGAHVVVGVGEALLTCGILSLAWRSRPELARALPATRPAARRLALAVTGSAVAVAALGAFFASSSPDVLEAAAAKFGLREAVLRAAPFAGYESAALAPWLVTLLGVGAGFAVGYLVLRAATTPR